ncbi:MAG: energy-coupling factor transporter transmembrane component T, partial [Bryobacteraceae bacterium]
VFLVALATSDHGLPLYLALLLAATALARLPLPGVLRRAAVVLPFCAAFAAVSALAGDWDRAAALIAKSYLSALAVLLLVATTPLPALFRGLEALGAPRFLLMVGQFLYRYLFVISEQAQHMRKAAECRGGPSFRAAAGALGVLFARSYARAENIHRSMIARGFQGHFPLLDPARFGWRDGAFVALAASAVLAVRAATEVWL